MQKQEYQDLEGGTRTSAGRDKSHRTTHILLLITLGICVSALVYAVRAWKASDKPTEPTTPGLINLGPAKDQVKLYYNSGQYNAELWTLEQTWQAHYAALGAPGPKDAVIFDIDDTLLSNWPEILASDFGFIPKSFDAWVLSANATAIQPTVALLNYLQSRGFQIWSITGRKDIALNASFANFQKEKINIPRDRLVGRTPPEYKMSADQFKSQRRAQLTAQGWNIVGCCGDQISDCSSGYAGYIMKVPNYMYFLP